MAASVGCHVSNFRLATELTPNHDCRIVQSATFTQIVDQRGDGVVVTRQFLAQQLEVVCVSIPATRIRCTGNADNEPSRQRYDRNAGFDKPPGQQEIVVSPIGLADALGFPADVKCIARSVSMSGSPRLAR